MVAFHQIQHLAWQSHAVVPTKLLVVVVVGGEAVVAVAVVGEEARCCPSLVL